MKPVNQLTREQRRVFQKYLTFILYSKVDIQIEGIKAPSQTNITTLIDEI